MDTGNFFVHAYDEVYNIIAKFLSPAETYSMCLTSKRFFQRSSLLCSEDSSEEELTPLLCTILLRTSFLSSLRCVLKKSGLTNEQIDSLNSMMSSLPTGSVLLSGSTMVQVATGKRFGETDLDIFCTHHAAPTVRSWLVKEANQVMTYVSSEYSPIQATEIHHIEGYGNRPDEETKGKWPISSSMYRGHEIRDRFFYEDACFLGQDVTAISSTMADNRVPSQSDDDIDYENMYRIMTLPGVPLPWAPGFHANNHDEVKKKKCPIDLIVLKSTYHTAQPAIDEFDIRICKATWNGRTFYITDPHLTFTHQSRCEYEKFMKLYQEHFLSFQPTDLHESPEGHIFHCEHRIRRTLELTRDERPRFPSNILPDIKYPVSEDMTTRDENPYRENWIHTYQKVLDRKNHENTLRLFSRLQKYVERDITILGLPIGPFMYESKRKDIGDPLVDNWSHSAI